MKTPYRLLLVALVAGLLATSTGWADLQKISDHVYAYVDAKNPSPSGNSYGANTGLIVGTDAALIVDTLISAKEAQRFLADIRKVTQCPIKYVVNTHAHLDHAWGNCVFVKQGAVAIGHQNALQDQAEVAQAFAHPEVFGLTFVDLEGTTLTGPSITFTDRLSVDLGDITVDLTYFGPTHTKDSIIVSVPAEKVLFTGDLLFTRYHPFLADGDFANWRKVLHTLANTKDETKIIPGHGPLSSEKDLVEMSRYLRIFDRQARILCTHKNVADAPAIAQILAKRLPQQQRTELQGMIASNLCQRYLKQSARK